MSTVVGNVNVNLRMNLVDFKNDVNDGNNEVKKFGQGVKAEITDARGSIALIAEGFGTTIPRHIQTFIAQLPGVGTALNSAFSGVAIVTIIGLLVEAGEKVEKFYDSLGQLSAEEAGMLKNTLSDSKAQLDNQTALLKAEYDLQIAKANGLDKDRLRVQELSDLVGLDKTYLQQLNDEKTRLQELLADQMKQRDTAEQTMNVNSADSGLAPAAPDIGSLFGYLKSDKQATATTKAIVDLLGEIDKANNGLKQTQAQAVDAGKALQKAAIDGDEAFAKFEKDVFKLNDKGLSPFADINNPSTLTGEKNDFFKNTGPLVNDVSGDFSNPLYGGTSQAMELYKLQTQQGEALSAASGTYDQTRTSAEKYAETVDRLNVLLKGGYIDQDTYNRAIDQAKESMDKNVQTWKTFGDEVGQVISQAALFGGSWSDAFKELAVDLIKVIAQVTILKSLSSSFSKGSTGSFVSSFFSGLFGGFKADGGPLDSNKWYIAGEYGPEPIWGGGSGAFAAGYPTMGGSGGVTINYYTDARGAAPGSQVAIKQALQTTQNRAVAAATTQIRETQRRT